eukprot:PhF_6_TR11293/c0_g1_i1/m.18224
MAVGAAKLILEEIVASHLTVPKATQDLYEKKLALEKKRIDEAAGLEPLVAELKALKGKLNRKMGTSTPTSLTPRLSMDAGRGGVTPTDFNSRTPRDTPLEVPLTAQTPPIHLPGPSASVPPASPRTPSKSFNIQSIWDMRAEKNDVGKQIASLMKENSLLEAKAEYDMEVLNFYVEKMYHSLQPAPNAYGFLQKITKSVEAQKTKGTRNETLDQQLRLLEGAYHRRIELVDTLNTLKENLGVDA